MTEIMDSSNALLQEKMTTLERQHQLQCHRQQQHHQQSQDQLQKQNHHFPTMDRKRLSLIQLDSGKTIWWLNSIPSKRHEALLQRQVRHLESSLKYQHNSPTLSNEAQHQHQQQQQRPTRAITPESPLTPTYSHANDVTGDDDDISNSGDNVYSMKKPSTFLKDNGNFHSSNSNVNSSSIVINSSIPVVHLGHCNQSTWLDFGPADANSVGQMRSLPFIIQAPQHPTGDNAMESHCSWYYPMEFDFDLFPFESGFDVSLADPAIANTAVTMSSFCDKDQNNDNNHTEDYGEEENGTKEEIIDPVGIQLKEGESKLIYITWCPMQVGGVREVIHLRVASGVQQVIVVGSAGRINSNFPVQERRDMCENEWKEGSMPLQLSDIEDAEEEEEVSFHFFILAIRHFLVLLILIDLISVIFPMKNIQTDELEVESTKKERDTLAQCPLDIIGANQSVDGSCNPNPIEAYLEVRTCCYIQNGRF